MEHFFESKKIGSEKKLGQKRFGSEIFLCQKRFGSEIILVKKNWVEKIFGLKKLGSKTRLEANKRNKNLSCDYAVLISKCTKYFLFRMAVALWSAKTPGTAQLERDIAVMNNKKKVEMSTFSPKI